MQSAFKTNSACTKYELRLKTTLIVKQFLQWKSLFYLHVKLKTTNEVFFLKSLLKKMVDLNGGLVSFLFAVYS